MFTGETKIRVRYGETDKMGYCYYGNYPEYFEAARSDVFRQSGCSYRELEEMGYIMPVISLTVNYKKPAHYDDLLTIKVYVRKRPEIKMHFEYETYNEEGELLNTGTTTLCFVNTKTGRPSLPPQKFQDVLDKYFDKNA